MFQINLGSYFSLLVILTVAQTFAKQNVQIQPRIILGHNAVLAQFPYYVFLAIDTTVLTVNKMSKDFSKKVHLIKHCNCIISVQCDKNMRCIVNFRWMDFNSCSLRLKCCKKWHGVVTSGFIEIERSRWNWPWEYWCDRR